MNNLLFFFLSNVLVKFFIFGSQILIAFYLSPAELGNIKVTMTYVELLSTVSLLGLQTVLLSNVNSVGSVEVKLKIEQTYFSFIFIVSTSIMLLCLFFSYYTEVYRTLFLLIPFSSLTAIIICFYQLNDDFKKLSMVQIITKSTSAVLLLLATYLYKLDGFIISTIFLSIFNFLILVFFLGKKIKFEIKCGYLIDAYPIAKYAALSTVISIISGYMNIYILSFSNSSKYDIGIYAFSLNIFLIFEILTATFQQYFQPKLSKLRNDKNKWNVFFKKINNNLYTFHFVIGALSVIFLWFISGFDVVKEFKYFESIKYIQILILSWIISSFYLYKGIGFISLGNTKINFIYSCMLLPVYFFVGILFVHYYDVIGAVYAKIITSILSSFFMSYLVVKYIPKIN